MKSQSPKHNFHSVEAAELHAVDGGLATVAAWFTIAYVSYSVTSDFLDSGGDCNRCCPVDYD